MVLRVLKNDFNHIFFRKIKIEYNVHLGIDSIITFIIENNIILAPSQTNQSHKEVCIPTIHITILQNNLTVINHGLKADRKEKV